MGYFWFAAVALAIAYIGGGIAHADFIAERVDPRDFQFGKKVK